MTPTPLAMLVLLCVGAAAQEVALGTTQCARTPASQAVGEPFGAMGTVLTVADWLALESVGYYAVPGYTSEALTLTSGRYAAPGRGAATLGKANVAPPNACGMGWAKLEERQAICLNADELDQPRQTWGWTNQLEQGDVFEDIHVYIGASQCQGGHHRHNIDVSFLGTTIVVDLSDDDKNSLRAAHVWVGTTKLPRSRNGRYTSSPGQFPYFVNVNDPPVIVLEDMDETASYWFAVHVNVCPKSTQAPTLAPAPTPVPTPYPTPVPYPTPAPIVGVSLCVSQFFIAQYWCAAAACRDGVNGNLAELLVEDGWSLVKPFGVGFTTEATGGYVHTTRLFMKEIEGEYTTPVSEGATLYTAVFATQCEEKVPVPRVSSGPGPVRSVCQRYCPPGSMGYQDQ